MIKKYNAPMTIKAAVGLIFFIPVFFYFNIIGC